MGCACIAPYVDPAAFLLHDTLRPLVVAVTDFCYQSHGTYITDVGYAVLKVQVKVQVKEVTQVLKM